MPVPARSALYGILVSLALFGTRVGVAADAVQLTPAQVERYAKVRASALAADDRGRATLLKEAGLDAAVQGEIERCIRELQVESALKAVDDPRLTRIRMLIEGYEQAAGMAPPGLPDRGVCAEPMFHGQRLAMLRLMPELTTAERGKVDALTEKLKTKPALQEFLVELYKLEIEIYGRLGRFESRVRKARDLVARAERGEVLPEVEEMRKGLARVSAEYPKAIQEQIDKLKAEEAKILEEIGGVPDGPRPSPFDPAWRVKNRRLVRESLPLLGVSPRLKRLDPQEPFPNDVEAICAALQHGDQEQRKIGLDHLGRMLGVPAMFRRGADPRKALPTVVAMFGGDDALPVDPERSYDDPNRTLYDRAGRLLVEMGKQAVPLLARLLDRKDVEVRKRVVVLLGEFEDSRTAASVVLGTALSDPSEEVVQSALESLQAVGVHNSETVRFVLDRAGGDAGDSMRDEAVRALGAARVEVDTVVAALERELLEYEGRQGDSALADAFGNLGEPAYRMLQGHWKSVPPLMREEILSVINEHFERVAEAIYNEDDPAAAGAMAALRAEPELRKLASLAARLQASDSERGEVQQLRRYLGMLTPGEWKALHTAIESGSEDELSDALEVLIDLGPAAAPAMPSIIARIEQGKHLREIGRTLVRLGPLGRRALPAFEKAAAEDKSGSYLDGIVEDLRSMR